MKRIDCEGEKQRVEISHQKLVDQVESLNLLSLNLMNRIKSRD